MRLSIATAAVANGMVLNAGTATDLHNTKNVDFLQGEFTEEKMKKASEMFSGSSAHAENEKFKKEIMEVKKKALHRHMGKQEALNALKSRMSPEQRAKMSLLVEGRKEDADETAQYVQAVTTLNDMYLSIDDERVRTLTTCSVELYEKWMTIFGYWNTIHNLWMMIGEANSDVMKAREQRAATEMERKQEEEKLDGIKSAQASVMADMDEDLKAKMADVALYKFIIGKVEDSCKKDGEFLAHKGHKKADKEGEKKHEEKSLAAISSEKPLLLQSEKNAMGTSCESKCSAESKMRSNAFMLKIFADPAVEAEAHRSLGKHAIKSFKETLKSIHEAEREEVADKYSGSTSFLQKSSESQKPWVFNDGQGCGCGDAGEMECSTMLVLIGQELECNKQQMREKEGLISKQEEENKKEVEEQNEVLASLDKTMENQNSVEMAAENEKKQYIPSMFTYWGKLYTYWYATRTQRFDCYLKLFDLENNYFCAIKAIRGYMKDLALEALQASPEDVKDCAVETDMFPTGDCLMPGGQEHIQCIEGESIPDDPDLLPTQIWSRLISGGPSQTPEMLEKTNNVTIALQCPETIQMEMKCSRFLCPEDCSVSEWGEFSTCTSECDTGAHTRTREVIKPPRFGGALCPDTSETEECNTHACDVDCVLHEDWSEEAGCLQACTYYGEERFEVLRKHVAIEAKGKGECPEKNHESRYMENPCPTRECHFDEVCDDVLDLVVAYECSAAVNKLGCWMMSLFIVELMKKIPSTSFGFPTIAVALVKFGNGMSVKIEGSKDSYYVKEAEVLRDLDADVKGLREILYKDTWMSWSGQNGWVYGFNNIGQALKAADLVLDNSIRGSADAKVAADKKILVLTKGKRAGCTVVKSVSEGIKKKGVVIDMVLFSPTYATTPDEYDSLQDSVTFPHKAHLHDMGPFVNVVDWGFRMHSTQMLVPKICPNAISKSHALSSMCDKRVQLLHRGRTCHNWTKKLTSGPVTLEECRNEAFSKGYQGFIWTDVSDKEDAEESNCLSHEEDGKVPQTDEQGMALETTCKYVPDYGKENPDMHLGWLNQEIASGNGDTTSHYKVLQSAQDCPNPYSRTFQNKVFGYEWTPDKYFVGAKPNPDVVNPTTP